MTAHTPAPSATQPSAATRFTLAVGAIDAANTADPTSLLIDGVPQPQALVEGISAQAWLEQLWADAPEPLLLAARAHHLRRWEVPRTAYPRTRVGYHAWRTQLYDFHAEALGALMIAAGYTNIDVELASRVLHKQAIKRDPHAQAHEDAVSLAFLEVRLPAFAASVDEEPLLRALRKTWRKMSAAGRSAALTIPFAPELGAIVQRAVAAD